MWNEVSWRIIFRIKIEMWLLLLLFLSYYSGGIIKRFLIFTEARKKTPGIFGIPREKWAIIKMLINHRIHGTLQRRIKPRREVIFTLTESKSFFINILHQHHLGILFLWVIIITVSRIVPFFLNLRQWEEDINCMENEQHGLLISLVFILQYRSLCYLIYSIQLKKCG